MKRIFIPAALVGILFSSCVPKRQLDDMEAKYDQEKSKRETLAGKNMELEKAANELEAWVSCRLALRNRGGRRSRIRLFWGRRR